MESPRLHSGAVRWGRGRDVMLVRPPTALDAARWITGCSASDRKVNMTEHVVIDTLHTGNTPKRIHTTFLHHPSKTEYHPSTIESLVDCS